MTGRGDQSHDQPLTALDRDRQPRRIRQLSQFGEQRGDRLAGVGHQPLLDDRPALVDDTRRDTSNPSPIRRTR
jgi:hypothetical protein